MGSRGKGFARVWGLGCRALGVQYNMDPYEGNTLGTILNYQKDPYIHPEWSLGSLLVPTV